METLVFNVTLNSIVGKITKSMLMRNIMVYGCTIVAFAPKLSMIQEIENVTESKKKTNNTLYFIIIYIL